MDLFLDSILELPEYSTSDKNYSYKGNSKLLPSLFSLDTEGRVINMVTFSKILAPGTRLGFVAASLPLLKFLTFYNEFTIQHASGFSQGMVLELLRAWGASGYEKHAVALQTYYTTRRDWIVESALKYLQPDAATGIIMQPASFIIPQAGMFMWFKINQPPNSPPDISEKIHAELITRNVLIAPGSIFVVPSLTAESSPQEPSDCYFRIAFSYAPRDQLDTALQIFAEVLKEFGCGKI